MAALNELSVYQYQSELAPEPMATTTDSSNIPTNPDGISSFGHNIQEDNQYLVYQGERIVSFRDLLRRYQYHYSYFPGGVGPSTDRRLVGYTITDFPFYRGWDPNGPDSGVNSTLGTSPYTYCGMTLINYLTPAFALRRGGMRHKVIVSSFDSMKKETLNVARFEAGLCTNDETAYGLDSLLDGDRRKSMCLSSRNTFGGSHMTPIQNNPCLEYETPFYTVGQRFVPARYLRGYAGFGNGHEITIDVDTNTGVRDVRIDKYISIAEDFQLGLFTGSPIWYVYDDPTPV
jgi:hypothetical protein